MTIVGSDGQGRPLAQSFVNLEQSVITQTATVQLLIDAKIKSAMLVMEAGERLLFLSHLFRTSSQPMIARIFSEDEFEGILTNTLSGAGMVASPAA